MWLADIVFENRAWLWPSFVGLEVGSGAKGGEDRLSWAERGVVEARAFELLGSVVDPVEVGDGGGGGDGD